MEGQQLMARAGGTLREDGHGVAVLQGLRDLMHHTQRIAALVALEIEGAGRRHELVQHRPVAHLGFRDESGRRRGIDGHNVQPGNVVGHEELGPRPRRALHHQRRSFR